MIYNFLKRHKLKNFSFFNLKWLSFTLLLTTCSSSVLADRALISVVTSRNGNVSYVNIAPLQYEAKKKNLDPIQVSPGNEKNIKPGELRSMELTIYSACNRGDPQKEAALGFRAQVLLVSLLLSPHPDDRPPAYYLLPSGWFRMLKEAIRGHPHFREKGILRVAGLHNKLWDVIITRSDVTGVANPIKDYSIKIVKETDQPSFIKALMSAAKPAKNNIPQVTVLLESPSLYVRATYNLVHKGTRQYHTIKKMNIIDWWRKLQKWCPEK